MIKTLKKCQKQWMMRECLEMIKKKYLLYVKFVKTRHHNNLSEFKRYRNFVTKHLRKTKDAYYEALFNRVSTRGDVLWREINNLLNSHCSRDKALESNIDNKIVKGEELANKFNVYFTTLLSSDLSNPSRACNSDYRNFLGVPDMSTAYYLNTTPEEVLSVFMSLKNTTARDIDDLQIKPIKAALDLLLHVLTHLINTCLSTGVFPERMKHARESVVYKSGDRNIFSNHRPISLLPVISKGLEKIV
uniref:Putative tick transposon n=1 Tax=Rhipicephalus microplus TaxID=6941 RepID=A0A6G5A9U6_RHIMP